MSYLQGLFTLAHDVILRLPIPCVMCYIRTGLLPVILLLPWSRILLENLLDFQLVKKFPVFDGMQIFFTVLIATCHLLLFSATLTHSTSCQPIYLRSVLILSSHLRLNIPTGFFNLGFLIRNLYAYLLCRHVPHVPPISSFLH